MRAKTSSEKSFERKVGDTRTFDEAENFSKSRGTSEIFKVRVARWFPGIWSLLKAALRTFPISQTKPYIARISHNLYGSRQWNILLNEGGKLLESFDDFLSARRQRFAGQTVTFIRTNTRKNGGGFSASEGPWERKVFSTIHSLGSRVKFLSLGFLDGSWREHSMRSSQLLVSSLDPIFLSLSTNY